MSDGEWGIYVQEGQALALMLEGGADAQALAMLKRLSEHQLSELAAAAADLAELAEQEHDRRFDLRPFRDPEAGLADELENEDPFFDE